MPDDQTQAARLKIAQEFVRHIGRGDADQIVGLLADNVVYRSHGDHALAGSFTGRDAVVTHLLQLAERTRSFSPVKWEDLLIGESHIATLVDIHAQTTGSIYEGREVVLVGFDHENKIENLAVFFENQGAIDRFIGR